MFTEYKFIDALDNDSLSTNLPAVTHFASGRPDPATPDHGGCDVRFLNARHLLLQAFPAYLERLSFLAADAGVALLARRERAGDDAVDKARVDEVLHVDPDDQGDDEGDDFSLPVVRQGLFMRVLEEDGDQLGAKFVGGEGRRSSPLYASEMIPVSSESTTTAASVSSLRPSAARWRRPSVRCRPSVCVRGRSPRRRRCDRGK